MDWQMISAVGQILGAAGVIATLGYLSAQIRSSTRAAQQRAAAELLDLNQDILAQISKDTESARAFRKGMIADPDLTEDEVFRFHLQMLSTVVLWQRFYHLNQSSDLEDWLRESNEYARRDVVHAPGFRRWFAGRKHWLTLEFREVLESEMAGPGAYVAGLVETSEAKGRGPGTT